MAPTPTGPSSPPPASILRVGLAQIDNRLGNLEANLATHRRWVERAKAESVELLVFPELSLTGYRLLHLTPRVALRLSESKLLADLAAQADNMAILVGLVEEVRQHPNADRLRVCLVNDGTDQRRNVVCGAANVTADSPARAVASRVQGFASGGLVGLGSLSLARPALDATAGPTRTVRVELASGDRRINATIDAGDESRLLQILEVARARAA